MQSVQRFLKDSSTQSKPCCLASPHHTLRISINLIGWSKCGNGTLVLRVVEILIPPSTLRTNREASKKPRSEQIRLCMMNRVVHVFTLCSSETYERRQGRNPARR